MVFLLLSLALSCAVALPTNFDARQQWGYKCEYFILDQGGCGSCWDFSSVEPFADRLCITGEAPNKTIISPEPILNCGKYSCGGGASSYAWSYMESSGDTTCTNLCQSGCASYTSGNGQTYDCTGKCDNGQSYPITYHAGSYKTFHGDINEAMNDLYNNGPIQTSFGVYQNFYTFFSAYPTGVYDTTNNTAHVGSHGVKIIGWGVQDGEKYWLTANSWGEYWGDHGYFKFARGTGICGFDDSVATGYTKKQAAALGVFGFEHTPNKPLDGGKVEQEGEEEWITEAAQEATRLLGQKTGKGLELVKVVSAETQVVAGLNFYLSLVVKDHAKEMAVDLQLFRDLQFTYSLV